MLLPLRSPGWRVGVLAASAVLCVSPAFAQTVTSVGSLGAEILPKGRFALLMEARSIHAEKQFNAQGDRETLLAKYDGINLNSKIFPLLPPGASLGTSRLEASYGGSQQRITVGYGLDDDITVGFSVGYGEVTSHVRASVSGSNLAVNPAFNPALPIAGLNQPFVPLGTFGLTTPVSTADVQNVLSSPAYGLRYKPLRNSTWSSALDPIIGLRWRFHHDENSATVFAPMVRFGLASPLDPNDLMQTSLGDGTNDILLGLMHTRHVGDNWDIKLTAQYTIQLADHIMARSRSSRELLVAATRLERVRRDRTDPIEFTSEAGYSMGPWRVSGRLEYARGGKDKYRSPTGRDTSGLEDLTDFNFLLGYVGLSWNGIPGYLADRSSVPAIFSIIGGRTLRAKNTSAPDSVYLTATFPF